MPVIFSCGDNLENDKTAKKQTTIKKETIVENEKEEKEEKEIEKQNSIETEVTRVMQEYGYTGLGTYISPSGNKWMGEWKDGKMNGKGTCIYSDGRKYVGEWKNNQWNGQGTLHIWEGYEFYVGGFKDGRFHGKGVYTRPSEVGPPIEDKGIWNNGIWTIRE